MESSKRKKIFEDMPVPLAMLTLAVPTILAQLVTVAYNLADTLFIGMLNDANMVAAVSLCAPMLMIMTAIANFFGVGGSSVISRALGVKNVDRAKQATTLCLYGAFIIATILVFIAAFLTEPIAKLLGASPDTLGYTVDYIFWTFVIGGVPMVLSNTFSHIVRSEGNSFVAGIGTTIGGLLNIALDPVFIFVLEWGVKGVAFATMLSNATSVLFFVVYLVITRKRTIISLMPTALKGCHKLMVPVASIGFPAALNSILVSVAITILNNLIANYGDIPLAAMGIVKKIDMVPWSIMFGLTHGILPLIGYNFAAKNYKRMKSVIKYAFLAGLCINAVTITLCETLAPELVTLFIKDEEVVKNGAEFLRIACVGVPFMSIGFLFNMTFQAMGKPMYSLVLSTCRQGLVFIPVLFLMDYLAGLIGLVWAQAISDFMFALFGILLFIFFIRGHEKKERMAEVAEPEPKSCNS